MPSHPAYAPEMPTRHPIRIASLIALTTFLPLAVTHAAAQATATTQPSASTPATAGTSATTTPIRHLRILVTNDDGVKADGIDALVEALRKLPEVEVTVIAPLANQSGAGSKRTAGKLATGTTTTKSGYPAIAVAGFPADSVIAAFDQGLYTGLPDLVVSGINAGQNLGFIADTVSGTVGAAREAARRGIPAVATSSGFPEPYDYATAVTYVIDWIAASRATLPAPSAGTVMPITNINVPTCAIGTTVRGEVEVPTALINDGMRDPVKAADCASTATAPKDDLDAFLEGYVAVSELRNIDPPAPVAAG